MARDPNQRAKLIVDMIWTCEEIAALLEADRDALPRKSGDLGIDGWTFLTHEPVQVKQSDAIGRPVIDIFETAIERNEKKKGYVVGLSFGKGAHEEVARVKAKLGLDIELVPVQALLDQSHPLAQEPTNIFGATLAPPAKRDPDTLPTVDELIVSDDPAVRAKAAETLAPYGLDESADSN